MFGPTYYIFWVTVAMMFLVVLPLGSVVCFWSLRKIVREYLYVKYNKTYLQILYDFCNLTYDTIYKDQILPFSTNGFQMSGSTLETSKRNFVKLCYELMGPNQVQTLLNFYGDEETLTKNLITWFTSKLDEDEILAHVRETAKMQTEPESPLFNISTEENED
jgi:hypothetical protein